MSSWQPIETVQYDGKPVLVWLEKPTHVHKSQVEVGIFHPNVTVIGSLFHFDQPKATHWMPLPEGPRMETPVEQDDGPDPGRVCTPARPHPARICPKCGGPIPDHWSFSICNACPQG